ncbi:putative MscS family protein.1 precursor [Legionella massiliensis]|uniref:Putative MscS family protein.1 n=1 Tax=Legionella massiliensis TaxID=1034943 RepID=A0A078L2U8_9GAMM|nr:mechanosensitive ion channel domain-containing protein [Legionella massiliensis]CDZ78419.1 putative MscS family protein.1 precursor [Legionella massiliensis]CEE14157.1 Miniconductance mechanosensitive channel MscM precursor [Legionella massiliensis]
MSNPQTDSNSRGLTAGSLGWLSIFFLAALMMASGLLFAKSDASANKLIEYLVQEKNNLSLALNEVKLQQNPASYEEYLRFMRENKAMAILNQAKIISFDNFLTNQNKQQQDYIVRLKRLQQKPVSDISSQERISQLNTLSDINKKTIQLINENLSLASKYQEALTVQNQQLELWKSKDLMHGQLEKLRTQDDKLKASLDNYYEYSIKIQEESKAHLSTSPNFNLEAKLLLNNQVINLTQHKIAEIDLQKKLVKADYLLQKSPDIRTLQAVTETYKDAINQLLEMEQSLKKMMTMLSDEQQQVTDANVKRQFTSLLRIVKSRLEGITIQQQTLQEDLENHEQELKKQLSVRQSLSEYRFDSWPVIIEQISHIPSQLYSYVKSLVLKVKDNYLWQDLLPAMFVWLSLGLVVLIAFGMHKILKRLTSNKERSRLAGHLYGAALTLIGRNITHLSIATALILSLYLNHVAFANYQLLVNLIVVWLTFRVLIQIASLALFERVSDSTGYDVSLFYRLKWLFLAGGWTTALMVISDELPLSSLLQDIFSRLFMLFLVLVSFVLWQSRDVIAHLLHPLLKTKKRYFRNAVMLLAVLIPLTLFTTAIIGLIGYINLAWTMSRYQVQILLIISGYVLLRGLFIDALELVCEWMISSSSNGWLWIEVVLKPLDKILRVFLFTASLYVLFQLFGWHWDSAVMIGLRDFAEYPLVNMSGIYITVLSIIEFLILSSVFVWASKWTRELSYRRLYRDARDAGIRNSLSVFTQYAVILIGGFISLRVLGLDFSGMSMVIGGLAVGLGFGLRDFASNIVGGLMLLIERPVREGDLITIGTHEGRVAHIGIRSMRVSSWDNTEVLVPNAETFNKPFTNWTHQDSIVRTVVPIKVSRADDPAMIQQLILDVLAIIPEIVADPPAQVFLKQIDDALIEFEVRYFINVQIHTRFEVRSKVLFAIMAQFKAAGVKPPIPPISIELKEDQHEPVIAKKITEQ